MDTFAHAQNPCYALYIPTLRGNENTCAIERLAEKKKPSARMRSECYSRVCLSVCVCVCVCVSVCRRIFWHYRLRGGLLVIPAALELREPENKRAIILKQLP